MLHSKRMPEWVSAHQIPGVWQLGRHDEANTPDLPVLMSDNGSPPPKHQRISVVDRDDIYGDGVNVAAQLERLCDAEAAYLSAVVHEIEGKIAC